MEHYRTPRARARRPRPSGGGAAILLALSTSMVFLLPAAASVGLTTAVVPEARGTPPAQPTRVLIPRLDLFADERIQTDFQGVTQILFLDGTNMTIGPNSDLVIDRFVYDPDISAGELAAQLGRGVLRFVGGQISKRGRAAITTPVAVIGVRGGIVVVEHDETGGTSAVLLFGQELTVTGLGPRAETRKVTRPGFAVSVAPDGTVSNPERLPAGRLDSVLASLEGDEELDGGAPDRPTREVVKRSAYVADASAAPGPATRAPLGAAETEGSAADTLIADNPPPSRETEIVAPAVWLYRLDSSNTDLGLPFLGSLPAPQSGLVIYKQEGSFEEGVQNGGYPFLKVRAQFQGQGGEQTGLMSVYLGRIVPPGSESSARFLGRFAGAARESTPSSPGDPPGTYHMWVTADEDPTEHPTPAFDGTTPPGSFHTAAGYLPGDGNHYPVSLWIDAHLDPGGTTSPSNTEWVLEGVAPIESVGPRGSHAWGGYAAGLFEARTLGVAGYRFEGTYSLLNRAASPEDVAVVANPRTGQLGAIFRLGQVQDHEGDQGAQDNAPANFHVDEIDINFGRRPGQPRPDGIERISGTHGTYISDEAFAALSSVGFDADSETHRLVSVNGTLIPRRPTTRTWMTSNGAEPATGLLPPGVDYCDCPAAKFGWWGGRLGLFRDDVDPQERLDSIFPGTFVVGQLPELADVPSQGTATYGGHAAAAIRNDGTAYAAVGTFSMNWDFATRTGDASIGDLDGRSYSAPGLTTPANPRDFSGTLSQVGGGASGSMSGSFFSDGTDPVRDVGGQFRVTEGTSPDTTYTAVGSFAATH